MSASMRLPLVVVLGATGSGKSKLALEIGRMFNGEIISADSMQIYKGLDIITNKVTKEELQQCPHHMIDCLNPLNEGHTVVDFRDMAVPIIDRILESQKIPIIVGGTNYYIEALMWKFLINKQDVEKATSNLSTPTNYHSLSKVDVMSKLLPLDAKRNEEETMSDTDKKSDTEYRQLVEQVDTLVLHRKLMEVDCKQGQKIHPHNRRKIIRALEVYQQHGVEMSKILESQKIESGENGLRGGLRYDNTCVFWIQTDKQVLCERTDKRVDQMIDRGLVKELQDFHQQYNISRLKDNSEVDYTHGIFQSIGFKEFHDYLLLPDNEKDTDEGKQLLQQGIEEMKLVTRRYAKKQVQWIRNRFLTYRGSKLPPMYGLDSTDVSKWEENVHKPAVEILTSVLKGDIPNQEPIPVNDSCNMPVYNICNLCKKSFTMEKEWQEHITGRKHHKLLKAQKKREIYEEYKKMVAQKRAEASVEVKPRPENTEERDNDRQETSNIQHRIDDSEAEEKSEHSTTDNSAHG